MSELITTIFENLTTVVTQSAQALKTCFLNLIYTDPTAQTKTISDLMIFVFTMMGLTIGIGIVYKVLSLVRIGRR